MSADTQEIEAALCDWTDQLRGVKYFIGKDGIKGEPAVRACNSEICWGGAKAGCCDGLCRWSATRASACWAFCCCLCQGPRGWWRCCWATVLARFMVLP